MSTVFQRILLQDSINLYVLPIEKFKTVSVFVFLHTPLTIQASTPNALLPMVLMRGTASHPTTRDLVRHLDELYGASIHYQVTRRGEVHSLMFKLELPAETYLSDADGLLGRGLDALAEVIFRPTVKGESFVANYVNQEKDNLKEVIDSLINNKRRYALARCREEMCEGEPYAISHLGCTEDLPRLGPSALHDHWTWLLESAPVDIMVVGNVDVQNVAKSISRRLVLPGGKQRRMPTTLVKRTADSLRAIEEPQPVHQGVLVVGFRTGTVMADNEFFPMVVANGVLGGYAHSKLFANVREKHSLAYYAYSGIETIKGLGFMYAGIDFSNYQRSLDITLSQLHDLQKGIISQQELGATVKALVSGAMAAIDSPAQMVEELLAGLIGGRVMTVEERVAGYQSITPEQVASAASRFTPELVYFITRSG